MDKNPLIVQHFSRMSNSNWLEELKSQVAFASEMGVERAFFREFRVHQVSADVFAMIRDAGECDLAMMYLWQQFGITDPDFCQAFDREKAEDVLLSQGNLSGRAIDVLLDLYVQLRETRGTWYERLAIQPLAE